jgi:hypothetical protein
MADTFGSLVAAKWTPVDDANFFIYAVGGPGGNVDEIAATQNNAELIIYNGSTNALVFRLAQTPASGGLSIGCSYSTTNISIPQNGWIHLRQVAGIIYTIVLDSTTLANSVAAVTEWNAFNADWTEVTLAHNNALANDWEWGYTTDASPTSINEVAKKVMYKIVGKTLILHLALDPLFDDAGSYYNLTVRLPWKLDGAIGTEVYSIQVNTSGTIDNKAQMGTTTLAAGTRTGLTLNWRGYNTSTIDQPSWYHYFVFHMD